MNIQNNLVYHLWQSNDPYGKWVILCEYILAKRFMFILLSSHLETKDRDSKNKPVSYRTKCKVLKHQIINLFLFLVL